MSIRNPQFAYPESLEKYMISASDFFEQNPPYNMLCCGVIVFDSGSKMLLVKRAKTEKAFPNFWEIPGGKVDDTDETILHAVVRELKEETGLEVTRVIRKSGEFGWEDFHERRQRHELWRKLIFEVEVKSMMEIELDPEEHQDYLFVTEDEVFADRSAGGVPLSWITPPNKDVNLEGFRLRREALAASRATGVD